ncbi:unnamed protein product [Penicillium roqueforti FM164]|uniref:Genomic scaffold, ProqFM164S01 n=1 Tax=Penicillium roqueforti (strain FM164) TaxID=1365484 RepID=W6PTU1_PENRF|nr:unnamed protein product [Penicillium roqueforti FM164]
MYGFVMILIGIGTSGHLHSWHSVRCRRVLCGVVESAFRVGYDPAMPDARAVYTYQ